MKDEYKHYTVVLCESSIDHHILARSDTEALKMAKQGRFLPHNHTETVLCIRDNKSGEFIYGTAEDWYDFDDEELGIEVKDGDFE